MGDLMAMFLIELIPWRITLPIAVFLIVGLLVLCAFDLPGMGAGIWALIGGVGLLLGAFWQYHHRVSTRP